MVQWIKASGGTNFGIMGGIWFAWCAWFWMWLGKPCKFYMAGETVLDARLVLLTRGKKSTASGILFV